ncbi:hypothetical protein [Kosakonia sp. SMBL-WEM22]|uniref:hypothetical protein n=1 Tax=Kosakonia sp. SMBL-WEM22 TaxID=2725560 RepID=UPI001CB9D2FF|nr:hypothetical protein [Kosakonia sp. SMBL-WEM22]MDV5356941.1 hypothetical protein [Enterobacter asburiae]
MTEFIIELIIGLLIVSFIIAYGFYLTNKRDKLMVEGRPVIAEIINVRPVSSDGAGNTSITYILNIEGRLLSGTEKIDTFYAPQFQKGKKIKLIYKNDNEYMFVFDR